MPFNLTNTFSFIALFLVSFLFLMMVIILDYGVDMLMKPSENLKHLDKATQEKLRYQVLQSILIHYYETSTSQKNLLMYKMMRHPHDEALKQLEAFSGSTWGTCFYPFRECLIAIER